MLDASEVTTSEHILDAIIKHVLTSQDIENNLIGVAGDGAPSVQKFMELLKEKFPYLYTIHCIPHCLNLIGNFASSSIPNSIEVFMRNIYNYFSKSALRTSKWMNLQKNMDVKPYRMIRHPDTRWSSLHGCIQRVLLRYEELRVYFTEHEKKQPEIQSMFDKPSTLIYLKFLSVFVSTINDLSLELQQNVSKITEISSKIRN